MFIVFVLNKRGELTQTDTFGKLEVAIQFGDAALRIAKKAQYFIVIESMVSQRGQTVVPSEQFKWFGSRFN